MAPISGTTQDLSRLFRPKSICTVGGQWASNVVEQCLKIGFEGEIWPVHPKREEMHGIKCFKDISDLPHAPDATFIGVNRYQTPDIVCQLSHMGAGGAVCFASGFNESDDTGRALEAELIKAAGDMPVIGPNCYGFINFLDGALMWPDQHGGQRCDKGVAIITQSSNISIDITMQRRGLPIAYMMTAGNQSQTSLADMGRAVLEDDRVTALGLYIEGFGDLDRFFALAKLARSLNKPVAVLKIGRSQSAQEAMLSHTASLAGLDQGADAFLNKLGIPRLNTIAGLIETLKLMHVYPDKGGRNIGSISCSGGEASLIADLAETKDLVFPAPHKDNADRLSKILGPLVTIHNPLDYHTFIWGDVPAMQDTYEAMFSDPNYDLSFFIIDYPRPDRCDGAAWDLAVEIAVDAAKTVHAPLIITSVLSENLPEEKIETLLKRNIAALCGLDEALDAAEALSIWQSGPSESADLPLILSSTQSHRDKQSNQVDIQIVDEGEAKALLEQFGVPIPKGQSCTNLEDVLQAVDEIGFPVVLKGLGSAHKSEAGLVAINLQSDDELRSAYSRIEHALIATNAEPLFLVEQFVENVIMELLAGVTRDPVHGFLLTLASGGIYTELLRDQISLLLPATYDELEKALMSLKFAPVLQGYRGKAKAHLPGIIAALHSISEYTIANKDCLQEVEINPLLITPEDVIAADALIRLNKS